MDYPSHPIAVLLGLDHQETLVPLRELPPPPVFYLPRRERFAVNAGEPSMHLPRPDHREFKLTHFRSPHHRWWHVYNEGRSRTPEDAFVYFEKAGASRRPAPKERPKDEAPPFPPNREMKW